MFDIGKPNCFIITITHKTPDVSRVKDRVVVSTREEAVDFLFSYKESNAGLDLVFETVEGIHIEWPVS